MRSYLLILLFTLATFSSFAQYCYPTYRHTGVTEGALQSVNLTGRGGTAIHDTLPISSIASGYANRIAAASSLSLQQGRTYTGTLTYAATAQHTGNQVWIDFNNDNVFADSEAVSRVFPALFSSFYNTVSFAITLPVNAAGGNHRMRIRNVLYDMAVSPGYSNYNLSACVFADATNAYYSGVTADYMVNIALLTGCSGLPEAGNVSGPSSACLSGDADLTLVNDTLAGGLRYQWYSKPVGAGIMAPIAGATTRQYHFTSFSAPLEFQVVATCPAGGARDSSGILRLYQNAAYECYCTNAPGGHPSRTRIDSISIAGTSLNIAGVASPNEYISYPDTGAATTTLMAGNTYALFLKSGGYSRYSTYLWMDYDGNGVFDTTEYVPIDTNTLPGGVAYGVFTLPLAADTGFSRIRIRTIPDTLSFRRADACYFETEGQTRDLLVNVISPINCAGTPAAPSLSSNVVAACSGAPFHIIGTGHAYSGNNNFQWQSRISSAAPFVNILGARTILLRVPNQTAATEYRLVVTCAGTGGVDSSSSLTINQNPFYLCYCSPLTGALLGIFPGIASPDSVSIRTTSLNHFTSTGAPVYAQNYPVTAATTATLSRGNTYNFNNKSLGSDVYNTAVWIDYNHNGTFDPTEYVSVGTGAPAGSITSGNFTIPTTADTSLTGLRVRTTRSTSIITATGSCDEADYGSTADYVIRIDSGSRCSGRPSAGIAMAGATSVCPSIAFLLSDSGATNSRGLTYQWISSAPSGTTYTGISGGTSLSYSVAGQTSARDYRLVVTCQYSGLSDTSTRVSVNMNAGFMCNCSPLSWHILNDSPFTATMDSFAVNPGSISDNTPGDTSTYLFRFPPTTTTTTTVQIGNVYVFGVKSAGGAPWEAAAWIDYNQNGIYETTEYIAITSYTLSGIVANTSVRIPTSASSGNTSLRVRVTTAGSAMGAGDACTRYTYGVTRDYVVNIASASACSGRPAAGTAISPVSAVCPGTPFTVSALGTTNGSGTTFQWYRIDLGTGVLSAIAGATSTTWRVDSLSAPSGYALVNTCASSGLRDTSNFANVAFLAPYLCYCQPATGTTLNGTAWQAPLDTVAIIGTTLANYTPGNDSVYIFYNPSTATTTASLSQGNTYTVKVNAHGASTYNAAMWIDENHNGIYEPAEYTAIGSGIASGITTSNAHHISVFADTGYTGMRVRTSSAALTFGSADACTYIAEGVTRDYVVHIAPGTPCTGAPSPGTAYATVASACSLTPFTVIDTGSTVDVGITYQWQYRPTGTSFFTDIPGATNTTWAVTTQTITTEYHLVTTCTGSGRAVASNNVLVRTLPFYSCYCGSPLGSSAAGTIMDDVQIPGSTLHIRGTFTNPYKSFINTGDSTGRYQRSLSYTFKLHVTGGSNWNAAMWIDYSRDGIFQTTEYVLLDTGVSSGTTISRVFTIPATADTGITGMRIRVTPSSTSIGTADACTFFTNSQTFDVKVKIDTLVNCTGTPNAGTISSSSPFACPAMTFSLSDSGYDVGGGLSYQWYKRTTGAYSSLSGATSFGYTVSGQTTTTDYIVVARCSFSGRTDTSNVLTITEYPFDSCYCSPPTGVSLVSAGGDSLILITTISGTSMYSTTHSPGTTGYVSVPPTLSSNTATLQTVTTYTVTAFVNYTRFTIADAGVWIDQDHSSTFDSAEYIHLTQSSGRDRWFATINLPRTTLLGLTGMRFTTTKTGTIRPSGSCNTLAGGMVQDHIITITRPPCYAISTIRATGVTDSGARVSWSPLSGASGYEYVINTTSTDPTVSGTPTTDTFVNLNCLTSNTTYYMHVRDSCGAGDLSGWITVAFTTSICPGTSAPAITGVTNTTAIGTWGAVGGSTGYEYLLDTSSASPSGSGTATAATSISFTGLTQGTTYYLHVRSGCRCTNRSAWTTVSFTTICDTIGHLTAYGILDTAAYIRWDSIRGVSHYEYLVDTSRTDPSGAGTAIADSSVRINRLAPGTAYFAHVRHACSGGFSSWTTIAFTTSRCDSITSITAYPGDTVVRVAWTAVAGASNYYYVINTSPLNPAGTGIPTTATTVIEGGLNTSTTYYVHIRTGCAGGLAIWQTVPFRTLACDTIYTISVINICDTTANISWTYGATGSGFLYVVDNSPASPTVRGTYTSLPSITLNTLSPGTTYYAHVRKLCGTTDTSAWVTSVSFATPPCVPVSGLTALYVTDTSARLVWTLDSCAAGYEYVVDLLPADPTTSGIFSPLNLVNLTSLLPGNTYYGHVRVVCGGGNYSAWVTIPFITICGPTIISISSIGDNRATVNWAPVAGAIGYEQQVDNTPTPPAAGSAVTGTSYAATGLLPATRYYAHVRVQCPGGFSAWADTPFTTYPVGIETVNNSQDAIRVFPNPANQQVTVSLQELPDHGLIILTDITGKVLARIDVQGKNTVIDLDNLAAGAYLLKFSDGVHNQVFKLNKQ